MIVRTCAATLAALVAFVGCGRSRQPEPATVSSGVSASSACSKLRAWRVPRALEEQAQATPWVTRSRLSVIAFAAERYCSEAGRYPNDLRELVARAETLDPRREACLFDTLLASDEWGTAISYTMRSQAPEIVSAGPDRQFSTQDDVSLPDAAEEQGFVIDARRDCSARVPR